MISKNFIEMLEESLKNNWSVPAFTNYRGATYTYEDVARNIAGLHMLLKECNLQQGEKVSLIGKNSAHWAILYLAVMTYGGVIVPILNDFHRDDMHHVINHSDSVLLFVDDATYDNLEEPSMPNIKASFTLRDFSILNNKLYGRLSDSYTDLSSYIEYNLDKNFSPDYVVFQRFDNGKLAEISYTSGTTGFSKGVMLSYNNLAANVLFAQRHMQLEPGDPIVSFLPLAHSYGCAFEFLFPFTLGCHINFLTRTPSPQTIVQAFQTIRPRLILTVPLVMEKIYKKRILPQIDKAPIKISMKLPFLKKVIRQKIRNKLSESFGNNFHEVAIGGAPLNKDVEGFLRNIKFPFTVGYGMTECGPLISYAPWTKTKLHSSGKIIDTLEATIDSNDPAHEVGEILVRGENVMLGYYKNTKATTEALDTEGWLHTGDLGLIDEKNNIFIKGRSKSLILGPSGQNIYPEEIESKLNNLPFIQESLVVEVKNRLVALVYPDHDMADNEGKSEEDIKNILEENRKNVNLQLPSYMNIARIKLYPEEFEKTPKRSIKRFLYQEIIE